MLRLAWTVRRRAGRDGFLFADNPENILAWLGPAIGPRAFEVGVEVREAFMAVLTLKQVQL